MRKITLEELKKLQKVEAEILEEFVRICDKHNLKYVLMGGSCLGAVKYDGIIPWDDDIDVGMNRDDYNKFIEIQKKELNDNFYIVSLETDDTYNLIHAKLKKKGTIYAEVGSNLPKDKQGIWIDIFPLDNVSDNDIKLKFDFIKVFATKIMISFKLGNDHHSESLLKEIIIKMIKFCSYFISLDKSRKVLFKLINKYNNKKTKRVISYGSRHMLKSVFDYDFCTNSIMHKFMNKECYIPKDYDNYLRKLYGDYELDLPKEMQNPIHPIEDIKF